MSAPSGGAAPAVTVVVPTRDRAARLERLLAALRAQTIGTEAFEVIVVDDGSRDETSAVLADADALNLRHVVRDVAGGPAAARNEGWRLASADLIAFTDDDCEPTPTWLERALSAAAAHPGSVITGPTTPIPGEIDRLGPLARTRDLPEPDDWFASCNIVYPRELLERLGGFDERFADPLGEDTDLGWRARELGADLHFEAAAAVHHAVEPVGAAAALREAMIGADAVYAFRRHPQLRRQLGFGVVRNRALPRLLLAGAALALARRHRWAAVLALPYALSVARRCAGPGSGVRFAPFFVVRDALTLVTSLRGSARHRILVL